MPLTSAEKQARYRARNVVLLTADAPAIAERLIEMEDQAKLIQVVTILKSRLDPTTAAVGGSRIMADARTRGSLAPLAARTPLEIVSPARSPSRPGSHIAKSMTH
jgi:hypothetical protein